MDSTKPYCGFANIEELKDDFRQAFENAVDVPNEMLPTALQTKSGKMKFNRLQELLGVQDEQLSKYQRDKEIKARNIEKLMAQVEMRSNGSELNSEIDYSDNETDEPMLNRNRLALVKGMLNGGLLDSDDFIEE